MSTSIIVEQDCSIYDVFSTLNTTAEFPALKEKFSEIGMGLKTPSDLLALLRKRIIWDQYTYNDALYDILQEWVARKGKDATLQDFTTVLTNCGFNESSRVLQAAFPHSLSSVKAQFSRAPSDLENLLNGDSPATSFTLLLETVDVGLTCKKILETVKLSRVSNFDEFLDFLPTRKANENTINVVTVTSTFQIKELIRFRRQYGKLVIVALEEIAEAFQEEMKNDSMLGALIKIGRDSVEWKDLTPTFQRSIRRKLKNSLGIDEDEEHRVEGQDLVDCVSGKELTLLKSNIPQRLPYYIPRTVRTRNVLSTKILEENENNIFVFSGIARHDLSAIAKGSTENSTNIILQREVTCPFLVLDHSTHFEKICKKTYKPVHWLSMNGNGKLKWVRSSRDIKLVQRFILAKSEQDIFSEEAFTGRIVTNYTEPICIADSPGMGKSVFLGEVGRRIKEGDSNRSVIFLQMTRLVRNVKENPEEEPSTAIKIVLEELVCESELGKKYFQETIKLDTIQIELLLDGLDEVGATDQAFAYKILKTIHLFYQSIRIWVTSRPHLLHEMEGILNTLGYTICPFDEDNQLSFLATYWTRSIPLDIARLKFFGSGCLNTLRSLMNSKDADIAGVPLQCLLIAEIYEKQAHIYAESGVQPSQTIQLKSICDLYELTINKKLGLYKEATEGIGLEEEALLTMHVQLSLDLLVRKRNPASVADIDEVLRVGLLEGVRFPGSPKFIHRTFAEYLVAQHIISCMVSEGNCDSDICTLLFETALEWRPADIHLSWAYLSYLLRRHINPVRFVSVIPHFLNSMLANPALLPSNTLDLCRTYISSPETLQPLMYACATSDYVNLFKLCTELGLDHNQNEVRPNFNKYFLLFVASQSSLRFFKLAHQQMKPPLDLSYEQDFNRLAVKRGHFSIFEYLVNEGGLRHRLENIRDSDSASNWLKFLLHDSVSNSHDDGEDVINQRFQIIHLLVKINRSLLGQKTASDRKTPLLSFRVHPRLLCELIRLGSDVFCQDDEGSTVLHLGIDRYHLSPEEYHQVVISVAQEDVERLVHVTNEYGETPQGELVRWRDPLPETLQYFREHGAEFHQCNSLGYSILANAIRFKRSRETLQQLIKFGGDVNQSFNWKGKSLLHYAALVGNTEGAKFLVEEYGLEVNARTRTLKTPLHYAKKFQKWYGDAKICEVFLAMGGK